MSIDTWLQDPSIREALGWTVVHFLWLGSLGWLLGMVGRSALRNAPPALRYWFSVACLLALTILPVLIFGLLRNDFVRSFSKLPPPPPIDYLSTAFPVNGTATDPQAAIPKNPNTTADAEAGTPNSITSLSTFGPRIIRLLPVAWLIGIAVYSAALMIGAFAVERLRKRAITVVDNQLLDQLADLKERLSIAGEVLIGYSDRLVSPVLIGLTRPMILLPISAMSGVSQDQLEMILLHELAHVRRRDNWVNLAQRVIEALLFFHPAVWSVSEWIRVDREYCCDETVVTYTENEREDYARTLAGFLIHSPQQGQLLASAMAQTPLLGRIRNILNQNDQTMKMTHKTIVPALVCFAAFNLLAYSASLSLAEARATEQTAAKTGRSGDSLLVKLLDSYQALDSLEGSGSIVIEMSAIPVAENATAIERGVAQKTSLRSEFSILLDRSNKLRLEWDQKVHDTFSNGGVAWSDGTTHAYQPSFASDPTTYDSSNRLLGAVQGVSSMLPETARLFEGTASVLSPLSDSLITGEESLEGVPCWVVNGKNSIKQDITIWVSKQDHLIRRYRIAFHPEAIELPESAKEAIERRPEAKAALAMASNRKITWEANFHELNVNQKIVEGRFTAAATK